MSATVQSSKSFLRILADGECHDINCGSLVYRHQSSPGAAHDRETLMAETI
jgi:hypothetical protein